MFFSYGIRLRGRVRDAHLLSLPLHQRQIFNFSKITEQM